MASPKPIILSPRALNELDETYAWILNKFGKSTLQTFHNKWAVSKSYFATSNYLPFLKQEKELKKIYFV